MKLESKVYNFLKKIKENTFKPDLNSNGEPKKTDTAKRAEGDILEIARGLGFQEIPTDTFREIKKTIKDNHKYLIGPALSTALNMKDPTLPDGINNFGKRLTKLLNVIDSIYTKDIPIIIKHPSNINRFPDFLILFQNRVFYLEVKTHWYKPDYGKNPPKHFAIYFEINYKLGENAFTFGKNMVGIHDQWELEDRQKSVEDKIGKLQKEYNEYASKGRDGLNYFNPGGRSMGSVIATETMVHDPNLERYQNEVYDVIKGESGYDKLKPNYDLKDNEDVLDERWNEFVRL
tara:strand:- start:324 stop:1190 length:867 start_codon:yes stop_codon:yes gene_type:complete